jgi:hypothetical protein
MSNSTATSIVKSIRAALGNRPEGYLDRLYATPPERWQVDIADLLTIKDDEKDYSHEVWALLSEAENDEVLGCIARVFAAELAAGMDLEAVPPASPRTVGTDNPILRKLEAAAKTKNERTLRRAMERLVAKHGEEPVREALMVLGDSDKWVWSLFIAALPEEQKQQFQSAGADIMADAIEDAGLRLEDHFRVVDAGGIGVSAAAAKVFDGSGVELPPVEFPCGIGRNPFMHPLTETDETGENVNGWGFASVLISGANGWMEANRASCREFLAGIVAAARPTVDIDAALRKARYDDRALLQLCSWAQEGFQQKCEASIQSK